MDKNRAEQLLRDLRREGIADSAVLNAIATVPREAFVLPECRREAYSNIPLPIGDGQTISQPFVVALMTQALELSRADRVLEVGTGSGYQCAVLAEIAGQVLSIERIEPLARAAVGRLAALGYRDVRVRVGDGSLGWPEEAPFDAILVTASCPRPPEALLQQLSNSGSLILPIGSLQAQELYLYRRRGEAISSTRLGPVRFVPLIGANAWTASQTRPLREDW